MKRLTNKQPMKSIYLNVKKQHIDESTKKDSKHCMIADAIRSRFEQAKYIKVDTQSIRFTDLKTGKRYQFFTPTKAQAAILAFDRGDAVKPFHFQLVDGTQRPMGWQATHPNCNRKGKKYRKTGLKRIVAKREREFGLRMLTA
jgi:hypothetical protein